MPRCRLDSGPRRGTRRACTDGRARAWVPGSRAPREELFPSRRRRTSFVGPWVPLQVMERGGRSKQASKEEMGNGGSAPLSIIAREGQPAPPTIASNDGFPCMSQGLVKSCSCRGSMGKRRRPRPINRHASTEAVGFWGPRCSKLDPWHRREAKPERTLGPGATIGVLGTGVPRLACLRPTAWLS